MRQVVSEREKGIRYYKKFIYLLNLQAVSGLTRGPVVPVPTEPEPVKYHVKPCARNTMSYLVLKNNGLCDVAAMFPWQ